MSIGLIIGIVVLALVGISVVVTNVVVRRKGYSIPGRTVVRCSKGHLFVTTWVEGGSLKVVRLGPLTRYQRCPVGNHWAIVHPVKEEDSDGGGTAGRRRRGRPLKYADPRPPIGGGIPVPVVYAWTPSTDPMDTSVVPDHEAGAYAAVRHLLGTGHQQVGHVTGPRQFRAVELRAAGAIRALADDGLELAPPGVLYGDWSEAWGRQAAAILARSCPEVDAVFCGNDEVARGVAEGMRDLGRRIPEDVALVGFDNWEIMSAHARVPLSTVDMDLHEVGRTAAQRLLEAIDGHRSRCRVPALPPVAPGIDRLDGGLLPLGCQPGQLQLRTVAFAARAPLMRRAVFLLSKVIRPAIG